MNQSTKSKILITVGTVLVLFSVLFMACFGLIFTSLLNKMLIIDPEGAIFDTFKSPSVPIYMDYYIFNVTNPSDIQNYGAKPIVVELGPYSYLEKMEKHDFKWNDTEGTVEYLQDTTYFFDKERSNGTLDDEITTLNAVMVIVAAFTFDNKMVSRFIWPEIERSMDLFQSITVDEMLYKGWELPTDLDFSFPGIPKTQNLTGDIYEILLQFGVDIPILEENRIGYMSGKNGTDDGWYKVKTGDLGMDDYLNIQEWDHSPTLDYWDDPYCNMINGTDGTQYPPGVDNTKTMRLFTTDLCRSMYLIFEKDTKILDIVDTYHYIPPKKFLESPVNNPDNECFCTIPPGDDTCDYNAMMNMQPCLGVPIVLSTPHFYQGYEEDIAKIDGLNPQKELHETYLDIEPTTGVVMEAAKRIQLNLPLLRYGKLPAFMNVPEVIFPLFWASENAQIPEKNASSLNRVLNLPYLVVYIVCSLLLVLGLILLVIGIIKGKRVKEMSKPGPLLEKK